MSQLDAAFVKDAARRCGFVACGIARAEELDPGSLDRMLAIGGEADMVWLRTQREARLDPGRLLPGARSVVALALGYDGAGGETPPGAGTVARYARGRDYHAVMKKKLKALVAELRARDPEARTFATSDAAPVMEKAWAERAGIGWVGKNGCLITERHGSWVLLATVILDRELAVDAPHPERCGSCEACLIACPTRAIAAPGLVDARRCISFWTIERRGAIPDELAGRLGRWMFGCDDCQTVCPWNHRPDPAVDPDLAPRPEQAALAIDDLLALTEAEYRRRFYGTSLARARYDGLVRNALLAAGREGEPRRLGAVRAHLASPHEAVRAAARWALEQLDRLSAARRGAIRSGVTTLSEKLRAAREALAVGPVEARALLRATGKDAKDYLHRMSTQDLNRLRPGEAAYATFLSAKGHVVAEGHALAQEDGVLLDLHPRALPEARVHLERLVIMDDVVFEDLSEALSVVPVLGAEAALRLEGRAPGAPRIAHERRGAPGIDVLLPRLEAEVLRAELVAAGAVALDDAELEALRILAGVPRFGADVDASRLPMEAGLTRAAISFSKGCYIGQEVVLRATARGHLQRGLVQLALPAGAGPGTKLTAGGQEVGVVTSAAETPEGRLGLGYLRRPHWRCGEIVDAGGAPATVRRVLVEEPEL